MIEREAQVQQPLETVIEKQEKDNEES